MSAEHVEIEADGPLLFLIPARAGSRRVPGKNLRLLAGIPLVGWAVRNAVAAARQLPGGPHTIVCSTDDETIAAAAEAWGAEAPFRRPRALADDDATSLDVALHALDWYAAHARGFRGLVLVQPTSPLALPADIVAAVRLFLERDADWPAVTVSSTHPTAWSYRLTGDVIEPVVPDVGVRDAVVLNGAAYVVSPARLRRTGRFVEPGSTLAAVMPPDRGVDVDHESDLKRAAALLAAGRESTFRIGDREIGGGAPCFVIAEGGVNHDGDRDRAHALVDAAADAGADAIKFQTWITERVVRPGARTAAYQQANLPAAADQFTMLKALELPFAWHADLKAHAERRGIVFLSTPDEIDSARFLHGLGVAALKIGSAELTNTPYLAELARLGLPLLLSTGMGSMDEVGRALRAIHDAADVPVALLHAVSAYPAPEDEMNLRCVETMRQGFGVPTGLSDHTTGTSAAVLCAGMGMAVYERHLTIDRTLPGPDHVASADPAQMKQVVGLIRQAGRMMGSGLKQPAASEADTRAAVRRTLVFAVDLPAGSVLEPGHVEALRTGEAGLDPGQLRSVLGRVTARAVARGNLVHESDLA